MKKKRCSVCGKMKSNLKNHIVKSHPSAYPDITAHYRKTYQSGATIRRNYLKKPNRTPYWRD